MTINFAPALDEQAIVHAIQEAIDGTDVQAMLTTIKNGPIPECPGLRFEDGRWVRRYRSRTGKMKQYTFARHEDITMEQAIAYVESVRGQENVLACCLGEPTIGAMIDRYLQEYVAAQRTSQALWNARSALTRNMKPIRTRKLDEITAADLHEIILTVKKRAPTMAQLLRSELKQAWSYALSIGQTNTACPITSLTGGKFKRHTRDRILSDTEAEQLLTTLHTFSTNLQDIITICLYTGLRSGEIIRLHYDHTEIIDGVLWAEIPREYMKNDQAHRVPLFSKAREAIERRRFKHCPMFSTKRGKAVRQAELAREVYRKTGGLWRLHDLRRTARTNLQRIGCPYEISETILAHKLPGVSGVYARFRYNDEKIKWLSALAEHYDRMKR